MKEIPIVYGSTEQAQPLIVGYDTVYVHTNIEQVPTDFDGNPVDNLWKYHEVQYTKDEYIALLAAQNAALETAITDMQLAMCELYERGV